MRLDAEHVTRRLRLEIPSLRHFDAWVAAHAAAGPPVGEHDVAPRPPEARRRADFEALIADLTARRATLRPVWFAVDRAGALVGTGTIFDVLLGGAWSGNIGYHVFNHHTGRGHGAEIAGGLVALGFGALGLHRVEACVEPGNAASLRVLSKVGFRREGRAIGRVLARGAWRDVEVYALTCEERGITWAPPP
ncbi:MAG: GNAT family N-acetyltransferase [Myxococcales bacterium]|nr:GNAT family N-acetyltransferase [Myxococcales bacterium]